MIVEVTKARLNSFWYANKIGQRFEVHDSPTHDDCFTVVGAEGEAGLYQSWIEKKDCKVVEKADWTLTAIAMRKRFGYSRVPGPEKEAGAEKLRLFKRLEKMIKLCFIKLCFSLGYQDLALSIARWWIENRGEKKDENNNVRRQGGSMLIELEQVTPRLESLPERTYKRVGKTVRCFKVLRHDEFSYKLMVSDAPVFELELPDVQSAVLLMDDLYYGEYTGG